jgi:hypothetical protein
VFNYGNEIPRCEFPKLVSSCYTKQLIDNESKSECAMGQSFGFD